MPKILAPVRHAEPGTRLVHQVGLNPVQRRVLRRPRCLEDHDLAVVDEAIQPAAAAGGLVARSAFPRRQPLARRQPAKPILAGPLTFRHAAPGKR